MRIRNLIFLILAVIWMGVIFLQSAKVADDSAAESGGLILFIGEHFVPGFEEWPVEKQQAFVESYDHPVRKGAHMAEYALLSMLLVGALYGAGSRAVGDTPRTVGDVSRASGSPLDRSVFAISWFIATVYAVTDEFHQTFVPGRSGEVRDVCFDSAGALMGVFLAISIIIVIKSIFKDDSDRRDSSLRSE